jgi:hypothetical protein
MAQVIKPLPGKRETLVQPPILQKKKKKKTTTTESTSHCSTSQIAASFNSLETALEFE